MADKPSQYIPSSFAGGYPGAALQELQTTGNIRPATSSIVKPQAVTRAKSVLPPKKKPAGYVPLTREQFMKAQSAGFTPDQIIEMEKRRKAELTPKPPEGNKLMEFVQGNITGATRGVGNIAKFIENTPTIGEMIFGKQKTNLPSIASPIQKGTEAISSGIENINKDLNKESIASKAGQFTGQVALTNTLLPGIGGATGLGSKVLAGATEGALQGGAFDVVNKGEVTKENVAIGAAFGGALPVVGAGLSKGKDYLTSKLPARLQLQGLMNPAKVTMLKKQLQTDGVTTPEDVAKWMLDRGIKGDKETIINTLINRAELSKQAVDDSLAAVTKTVESNVAKKALQQSYDDMVKVAGLEDDAAKTLALLNKDTYTLSELNQVKRILDDQYNLYTKTGDPTAGLKAKGLQEIRRQIRETIENVAEKAGITNIKALNNETQIARGMADAIARKDSADAVREALTAFAPTGVGGIIGGVAGPFDNNTIEGKVGNILLGMFVGRVAGSTKLKTNVASLLNKLSKQEIGALDAYIKSGGKSALPIEILDKIDETIKLLPPPSGLPTSANVVDVKPMTGFSPGVLQKQSEAISSKVGTQPLTTRLPENLSKSAINSEASTILPKKTPKVSIPGTKVNTPIIQKTEVKANLPKTPQVEGKTLEPLIKEAKKYDTLEDFVKAVKNDILDDGPLSKVINDYKKSGGKDVVLKDFYLDANKPKPSLPLSQKSEVKYSEPDSLTKEARKYKTADEFYKAQTDPLLELKKLGKVKKGVAEGTVTTAIDDIGGIDNVTRGTTNINKLETTETINTNSMRYKAIKEEVENGNITPIIVDDYLRVMDGHHRLAAYKAMGMTEIPVIAPKMTSGVKRTTFSEYKDIWEQANKSKSSLPMSAKSEVKYSKPDLASEAKKYKSAEEFVKAQETLYHGTQAVKAKDYTAIESKMKDIYKKLGHEYKESDSVKIVGNAEELVAKRSNEKLSKVQSEIADLQELLSRKISKPSSKFAGSSNKDVRDNSLGSFLTPDRDFAGRFTYDISYDLAGRKTIQQKNGYLVENYFKGDTLDLSKASDYDLDFLSKTLNMPKKDIVAELKTKGGTKEIQKKLAPKKDIISKEYDAVSNYAYDSEAKKWKKEIAVINDEALYTKQQLLDIYNKANKK